MAAGDRGEKGRRWDLKEEARKKPTRGTIATGAVSAEILSSIGRCS
jgi:hypothetical protein